MPHAAQSHAPDISDVPTCKSVVVLLAFGHANIFRVLMAVGSLRLTKKERKKRKKPVWMKTKLTEVMWEK